MWSLLLGLGSSLFDWLSKIYMMMEMKQWICMALVVVIGISLIRLGTAMLEFLKSAISSTAGRYIIGGLIIFSLGAGLGWFGHKPPPLKISKGSAIVKELNVRNKATMVRGQGLIKDGLIYYKGSFVNKVLERSGSKIQLKEKP